MEESGRGWKRVSKMTVAFGCEQRVCQVFNNERECERYGVSGFGCYEHVLVGFTHNEGAAESDVKGRECIDCVRVTSVSVESNSGVT